MAKDDRRDIFYIPHRQHHLIYMPLRGVLFSANAGFVDLLSKLQSGDKKALAALPSEMNWSEIFAPEAPLTKKIVRRRIPEFRPTGVSLFLTGDCTLRCIYCYACGGDRQNRMPWSLVTGIIDVIFANAQAIARPHVTINFHGGGDIGAAWPLLLRSRRYIQKKSAAVGIPFRTSIGTNGYLSSGQSEWIARHINTATVSIDGPAEIQNRQRPTANGGESFARVHETLKTFDRLQFDYAIRSTITAHSVNSMPDIVAFFCREYGARRIKLEPMYPRGRALTSACRPPSAQDFVAQFRRAKKIARAHGRELIYSAARLHTVTHVFCQAAGESCAVTPEGRVTSCYEVLSEQDPLSRIFFYGHFDIEQNRFIIDEKKRAALFKLNVLHKPFCADCFCKWHCAGDCPAKSPRQNQETNAELPDRCYITQELCKDMLLEALGLAD